MAFDAEMRLNCGREKCPDIDNLCYKHLNDELVKWKQRAKRAEAALVNANEKVRML